VKREEGVNRGVWYTNHHEEGVHRKVGRSQVKIFFLKLNVHRLQHLDLDAL